MRIFTLFMLIVLYTVFSQSIFASDNNGELKIHTGFLTSPTYSINDDSRFPYMKH